MYTCIYLYYLGESFVDRNYKQEILLAPLGETKNGHHNAAPSINKFFLLFSACGYMLLYQMSTIYMPLILIPLTCRRFYVSGF